MLSSSPAVLITSFNPSFDVILANLLISAGIPTLCGTSAPLRVDSGGTNVTLRWEDPSTIPEVFDTGHTIRTVVLGLPDSVGHVVLGEMKSFADLAKAEGVVRFVLLGTGGLRMEEVSSYLEQRELSYTVVNIGAGDVRESNP